MASRAFQLLHLRTEAPEPRTDSFRKLQSMYHVPVNFPARPKHDATHPIMANATEQQRMRLRALEIMQGTRGNDAVRATL